MEIIDLRKKSHISEGSFSLYFKLSKDQGLKVYAAHNLRRVQTEFRVMLTLHKARLAPKPHKIVKVKYLDPEYYEMVKVRYGIVCEHIRGKAWEAEEEARLNFRSRVRKHVRMAGDDLFEDNILFCAKRRKPVVVDFGWMYLR